MRPRGPILPIAGLDGDSIENRTDISNLNIFNGTHTTPCIISLQCVKIVYRYYVTFQNNKLLCALEFCTNNFGAIMFKGFIFNF
jgi:hypothetical protein